MLNDGSENFIDGEDFVRILHSFVFSDVSPHIEGQERKTCM